jgi:outer membrane receptor protein involved in Fe transport
MIPLPAKNSTLTLRADEGWTSAVNTAPDDTNIPIGSYGLLGLSAVYQPTDQRWNSKLYVTNLLDKYYLLSGYNIPPLGNLSTVTVGFRRMWGITFNYLFQ